MGQLLVQRERQTKARGKAIVIVTQRLLDLRIAEAQYHELNAVV